MWPMHPQRGTLQTLVKCFSQLVHVCPICQLVDCFGQPAKRSCVQMEPLEEEQDRPQQAPASPQRAPSPQPPHDLHASQRPMSPQGSISPQFSRRSRRQSIDQDGFDSDPESSSRALRLRALHNSPGSAKPHLPSPRHASPRASSPPGRALPRKGGIRRVQSEAQLLTRLSRPGEQLALGSFGSQTSDSTRSFDEYLRRHRSRSPSPKTK